MLVNFSPKVLPFMRQCSDNKIRRMRCAFWVTKAADTHPEYVIIRAFPWQQWFRERAAILRLYLHCLSVVFLQYVLAVKGLNDLQLSTLQPLYKNASSSPSMTIRVDPKTKFLLPYCFSCKPKYHIFFNRKP
jgi:hypothetical protein